LAYCVK
ncbi:glutathione peroxidase domain protein, partial [Vibrio parahaemolyticus V-223/04]